MVLLLNQLTKKEDKEPKSKDIFKGIIQRIPIKKTQNLSGIISVIRAFF